MRMMYPVRDSEKDALAGNTRDSWNTEVLGPEVAPWASNLKQVIKMIII